MKWFDVDSKPHLGLNYQGLNEIVLDYTTQTSGLSFALPPSGCWKLNKTYMDAPRRLSDLG